MADDDNELQRAREMLAQDGQRRAQECFAELEQLLKRHHCVLDVVLQEAGPLTFKMVIAIKAL